MDQDKKSLFEPFEDRLVYENQILNTTVRVVYGPQMERTWANFCPRFLDPSELSPHKCKWKGLRDFTYRFRGRLPFVVENEPAAYLNEIKQAGFVVYHRRAPRHEAREDVLQWTLTPYLGKPDAPNSAVVLNEAVFSALVFQSLKVGGRMTVEIADRENDLTRVWQYGRAILSAIAEVAQARNPLGLSNVTIFFNKETTTYTAAKAFAATLSSGRYKFRGNTFNRKTVRLCKLSGGDIRI